MTLPAQTQAAWTKLTVAPELRLALRAGSRLTLYAPGFSTTGVVDRFRYMPHSPAREIARQREKDKAKQSVDLTSSAVLPQRHGQRPERKGAEPTN